MSPSFIKRVFSRAKYKYHPSPYGKIKKIQFVLKLYKAHFQIHPYQPMPLHLDHRLLCCGDDRGRANAFYKQVKRFVPALYIVVLFLIRSYNATLCSDIHIRSGRLNSYWHCITLSSQHKLALTILRHRYFYVTKIHPHRFPLYSFRLLSSVSSLYEVYNPPCHFHLAKMGKNMVWHIPILRYAITPSDI